MAGRKRRITGLLVTVVLLAGGVGGVLYGWDNLKPEANPGGSIARIPTVEVTRGDLRRTVDSIGQLKAARSSIVNAPFDGKIIAMVEEGTPVAEGEPVIWLDTEELLDRLRDEEARLELALKDLEAAREEYRLQEVQNEYNLRSEQARVELAEQRLQDARQKLETERILVERNISARSRLEDAELSMLQASVELRNARINLLRTEENLASNLRVRRNAIERAELEIARIERNIEDVEERLEQAVIRAPVAGEVAYVQTWRGGAFSKPTEGDTVFPRLNLAEIPDRTEMLAVIPVNELDIAAIRSGQSAVVLLDSLPGREFEAVVLRRSIMPIETQRGGGQTGPREFEVEVRINGQYDLLYQGMTAAVSITVAKQEDVLRVPLEALTLEDDTLGVFVARGGSPAFVPVTVSLLNDRHAAVNGELEEGSRIYLRHPNMREEDARRVAFAAIQRAQRQLRQGAPESVEPADRTVSRPPAPATGGPPS